MKQVNYNALAVGDSRLNVGIFVPESTEEYDKLPGVAPGTCLANAIVYEVYHGTLTDVRAEFCERFEAALKKEFPDHPALQRKTKPSGRNDKDSGEPIEVWAEAELAYVRRALAELAALRGVDTVPIASFQPLMDEILADVVRDEKGQPILDAAGNTTSLIRFDPAKTERSASGPKKVPKVYLTAAKTIADAGKTDAFFARWELTMPERGEDETDETFLEKVLDVMARKIQALEDAERAKQDLAGKYA